MQASFHPTDLGFRARVGAVGHIEGEEPEVDSVSGEASLEISKGV